MTSKTSTLFRSVPVLGILSLSILANVGCTKPVDVVAANEKKSLLSTKKTLTDVLARTAKASAESKFDKMQAYYLYRLKKQSDDAKAIDLGALRLASGKGSEVTELEQKPTAFEVKLPVGGGAAVSAIERLATEVPALWVKSVKVDAKTTVLRLSSWPASVESEARARSGTPPRFADIKLAHDLRKFQVSDDHIPHADNKALFAEVKALYAKTIEKQEALLQKGHSQGVQLLAETLTAAQLGFVSLPAFAPEFKHLFGGATPLLAQGNLDVSISEIAIKATLTKGTDIATFRKTARAMKRVASGDAPPAGSDVIDLKWRLQDLLTVIPFDKAFVIPVGFKFDASPTKE